MSDDQDFVKKGSEIISEVAKIVEPKFDTSQGKWLFNYISEETRNEQLLYDIASGKGILKSKIPIFPMVNLGYFTPRADIAFEIDKDLKLLGSHKVTLNGKPGTIHVYEGGVKFPSDGSSVSMWSQSIIDFVIKRKWWNQAKSEQQEGENNQNIPGKSNNPTDPNWQEDHYWFAVPSIFLSCIEFAPDENGSYSVLITQREYARRFAAFNNLEGGVWQGKIHRNIYVLMSLLAGLISIGGCIGAFYLVFDPVLSKLISNFWKFGIFVAAGCFGLLISFLLLVLIPKKFIEPL